MLPEPRFLCASSRPGRQPRARTDDPAPPPSPTFQTRKEGTHDRSEPKSAALIAAEPTTFLPWELVRDVLAESRLYWLATDQVTGALGGPPLRGPGRAWLILEVEGGPWSYPRPGN